MQNLYYIFRWVVVLSITIFVGFFGGAGITKYSLEKLSEKPKGREVLSDNKTITRTPTPSVQNKELTNLVSEALIGTKGQYGIVYEDLTTHETYKSKETRKFESASLYKLWVMATVFEQIKENKLTLTQTLSQDIPTLNTKFRIATESAERTEGRIEQTVADSLNRMITYSDNYSALLLTEKIKLSNITLFLKQNGFVDSKVGTGGQSPVTTPLETALFFKKLIHYELASKQDTDYMLDLLKKQSLNGKIPKYLPDIVIAHKTGELDGFSHDGGIVFTGKGNYILVVMSESTSRELADERIAGISKAVYEYQINK